jgi:protein MpaA
MMKSFSIGATHLGLEISGFEFECKSSAKNILLLGGVHGDEIEGVIASFGIIGALRNSFAHHFNFFIIPQFNIDGVMARTRGNHRGVDLNRNLPTADWSPNIATPRYHPGESACSEPENQALVKFLKQKNFEFIYSLHSWKPMLNINGDARKVAEVIHQQTGYIIDEDIGYPTPGSLGSFGLEKKIPVLTYEIERGLSFDKIISVHVPAICESLKVLSL